MRTVVRCLLLPVLLAACLTACRDRTVPALRDEQGRTLLLHGVNVASAAKSAPDATSWHTREDYARLHDWGLHAVRLLVFWSAIEPQPGVYDEAYVERVAERVGWARELGLLVVVDMHQDLYSAKYTGDGAPEWACLDEGQPFEAVEPWWMRNLQPAVRTAWNNFWETDELQAHAVEAFAHLAERLAGDPAVLGYDLMNEPFGYYEPAVFEAGPLAAYYRKLGARLAQADPGKTLFFEPLAYLNPGLPSKVGPLGPLRAAYFPHYYQMKVHEGQPYDGDASPMRHAVALRLREAAAWRHPLLFGEIGVPAGVEGATEYLADLLDILEKDRIGWFYWAYDRGGPQGFNLLASDGTEYPVLDVLVRTHPVRTAGDLTRFGTDAASGVFELVWTESGATGPTEIAVPRRRWPQGFSVESSDPEGTWSWTHDPVRQVLEIHADPRTQVHTVRIVPKR
jgi:endoglycosylceramidase